MAIKEGAVEQVLNKHYRRREDEQERIAKRIERDAIRRHDLLRKLLVGERLTAEEGRELWWSSVCNGDILKVNPMTGNAQTYHLLGKQEWAKEQIEDVKQMDIGLFQKMEREAYARNKNKDDE